MSINSQDLILRATGETAAVRYVLADLTAVCNQMGQQHGAQGWALATLAETTIASVFLSSMLKNAGSVMVEAQYDGDISVVRGESTPMGLIRGFMRQDELIALKTFEPIFQPKLLRIKKLNEQAKTISEGIVEMESLSMGRSLATYLLQSEQIKNAIGIEAKFNPEKPSELLYAVGYLLEAFPDADEKTLIIAEEVVKNLPTLESFYVDGRYQLIGLLDQLAGPFPYMIHREIKPEFHCPCDLERVENSIASLGKKEVKNMIDDAEDLEIFCDYCRECYHVPVTKLTQILETIQ